MSLVSCEVTLSYIAKTLSYLMNNARQEGAFAPKQEHAVVDEKGKLLLCSHLARSEPRP